MVKEKICISFYDMDLDTSQTNKEEFYKTLRKRHNGIDFYPKAVNEELQARVAILRLLVKTDFVFILSHATSPKDFIRGVGEVAATEPTFDDSASPYWQLAQRIDASQQSAHYVYYWYQGIKNNIADITHAEELKLFNNEADKLSKEI